MNNQYVDKETIKRLYEKHKKNMQEHIAKEQKFFVEKLANELENDPLFFDQDLEGRRQNRQRLLNYVHRYVFLYNLKPIDIVAEAKKKQDSRTILKEASRVRAFLGKLLLIRNFLNNFFKLRSIILIFSALFFFFCEYWVHYYSSFSFKDVNITYQSILEKIPPFC
jgi:hypothetical protein